MSRSDSDPKPEPKPGAKPDTALTLTLNGEPRTTDARTVRELIEQLGYGQQAVAVELNRELIPRRRHDDTELHDGDHVELVTLVGGG